MIDPRNYIPGCVSYTKASEISSLQKYLKKGIKKRDEALELPENPDELNRDPRIPGITELPKGAVSLHDPREVTELPNKSLKIINPREESLETYREDIESAGVPGLPETAVGLTDNRETALEDHREDIEGTQEITALPTDRLDINETITPELPEGAVVAPGEIKEPESLENTRVGIEGKIPEATLETAKLETPKSETDSNITELPDTVIEGPEERKKSLETHRENIKGNKTPGSLETHQEKISDKRPVSLENHKDTIDDKRKVSLENHREDLDDKRVASLEDHREDITDKNNPKLSDHKEVIEDKRNISLEDRRENLEDKRNPSLETHKDVIEDKRTVDLDDTQLKTPGKQKTPELSGTVISGPEVKEVGLEKSKIGLEDKRNISLETSRQDIEDKRNPELSNHQETISDKRNPELQGTIIGLEDKRNILLENRRENIKNQKTPELSDDREDINVPGTPGLPTDSVGLKAKTSVNLEDHREKLTGTTKVANLPEDSSQIPGETKDVSLPTDASDVPGEIEEAELDETKIIRPGIDGDVTLPTDTEKLKGTTDVDSLESSRLDLTDDRGITLPEGSVAIEGETPDLDQIYSDTESKELYPLEGLDVSLPDTRLDITDNREPFLEDEQIKADPDQNPIGWNESLEDERLDLESPGTPDLVTIDDIKAETGDNWTIEPNMSDPGWDGSLKDEQVKAEPDQNPIGWDGELVTKEDIIAEPEDNWTVEPDQNPEGWDESLVSIEDIKAEPEDNWTVEPDKNKVGWDENLVTIDDIITETGDNWTVEPDLNPIGWDGDLVTKGDIIAEPEDNWTVEPDKNPVGWDGDLVAIDDIKAEPEDNWTVEPDLNPEGWDETLVTVDDIISEPEDNWTIEPDKNPEGWNEELVTKEDIKAEPEDNWTVEPDKNEVGWDESLEDKRLDITNINDILGLEDEVIKITSHTIEEPMDPDHAQKFVDISYNHSFDQDQDRVSSSIVSTFSDESMTSLEAYGKATETPESRPDHMDPEVTDNPKWKHIDTPSMSQGDFNNYNKSVKIAPYKVEKSLDPDHTQKFVDTSHNHSFKKDSDGVSSSIESNFSNKTIIGLEEYGATTETPVEIAPTQGTIPFSTKKEPDAEKEALKGPFYWSESHMGRRGWKPQELAIPAYKLGGSFTSYLNPSKYLRWVVENTVGAIPFNGSLKQWILDEALAGLLAARDKLEKELNLQPYRLPGSNEYAIQLLRQSMSGVDLGDVKNLVSNSAANLQSMGVIIKNPINRPGEKDKTRDGQGYRWEAMEKFETKDGRNVADAVLEETDAKSKVEAKSKKAKEIITKALGSNQGLIDYTPSYLNYTGSNEANCASNDFGLIGTLNNLARQGITKLKSFDQLKDALENSPYATTSSRFYGKSSGSVHRHDNALTLDSNHVWEIIFEPYLGKENGDKSFLPSIQQINYENYHGFGINTNWDTWIPFTSFELNSKKMVQKNLGLYSGEISIPQNLEFTNELRLVICDDQYKSWKRYFDMVMYASTYLCEVHDRDYYTKKTLRSSGTFIDTFTSDHIVDYYRGVVRPAPYKNLTFRCKILSMNPQFQTINMSDLLVVLKDFTEEWQGEVDSSPTELALMFSVVGENPSGEHIKEKPRTISSAVGQLTTDNVSIVNDMPGTTITN